IRQIDQAAYRFDPRTSGLELRLDPRLDAKTDQTEAPRAKSYSIHGFSLLARLAHTARTGDRTDRLIGPIDQFMHFYNPSQHRTHLAQSGSLNGHGGSYGQSHIRPSPYRGSCFRIQRIWTEAEQSPCLKSFWSKAFEFKLFVLRLRTCRVS
ncbi:hypothetical protein IGI04_028300, partial [Brassica rapa subsp. trilocularis]